MYQDNKSAILIDINGKISTGKISQELNICYFFMADQFEEENLQIEYFPTDKMW